MNKNIMILVFLLLLAGTAVFVNEQLAVTGFTVTSVTTEPNIISESTNLAGARWMVSMVLGGGGESLSGTLTPAQTAQLSSYSSEYPLDIKVTAVDETFTYPIKNTGQGVYKYTTEIVSPNACINAEYVIQLKKDWYVYKQHVNDICVYKVKDGILGNFDNPTNRLTSNWQLTADGYRTTGTVDTFTSRNIDFTDRAGNWLASAEWTGNLVTGDTPPDAGYYVASYALGDEWGTIRNNWKISPRSEFTDYKSAETIADARFKQFRDFPDTFKCDSKDACLNIIWSECDTVNLARFNLLAGADATIGTAQTVIDRNDVNAGKVSIQMTDRTVAYQTIRMLIRADWLGVRIPVGDPEILSVTCPDFASGDATGLCDINVRNAGTGSGVFYATFPNCGIFSQAYPSNQVTFDAGEVDNLRVFISHGTATQDTQSACTVKVVDAKDSSRYDTASAMIHMTAPKTCVPDAFRVSGSCVYQCNLAGTGELEPMCCGSGEVLRNDGRAEWDGWFCEGITGDDDDDGDASFLDDLFDWLFGGDFGPEDIMTLIIAIVMLVVILYLSVLILPMLLPLLGRAIIGLFARGK